MENKFTGFLIDSKSVVVAIFSNDLTHASVASSHFLKITQNVAFEFLNFGIFLQFLSY